MAHRIVILGGGTAGTLAANRLDRLYGDDARITVVDHDDRHVYQPGLLFVPFGLADPREIVRSRRAQLRRGVSLRIADVEAVDAERCLVSLAGGDALEYDVLVIATGAQLQPEETEGMTGAGWGERIFTFYTTPGAAGLRDALAGFDAGRLVVNVVDMPIKCPVAPLEFCLLADWHLRERGVRGDVEIVFATPLDGAFTKPVAAAQLAGILGDRGIAVETEFATGSVDGAGGRLVSWDEREIPFDLLVTIPLHGGADFVTRSPGLGDELGFVRTDPHTLRCAAAPNVFAIGDATDVPTSKSGSAAHFEAETLVANIGRHLRGDELIDGYGGHVNCFIETGFHRALLIDFDYEAEPLPGRYPSRRLGPLPLLRESRLNHLAKLAFQPLYWHVLLPGHDVPGIDARPAASRRRTTTAGGAG